MTDKTPFGIDLIDSRYGGVFRGRPFLVSGPSKSGKTAAAFHFLRKGLRLRERCLILTARPAADVLAEAEGLGMGFADAAREGQVILLEYGDDVPGRHSETQIMLPPDSFMQLASVISDQAVMRLVLDTCVPWVAVNSPDHLEEHVFSFIRSLDRMGVTTMLTMPKAASLASAKLYKMIEAQVPISLTLDPASRGGDRLILVNKYLGMDDKIGAEIPFAISHNLGITAPDQVKESADLAKGKAESTESEATSEKTIISEESASESALPTVDRRSHVDRRSKSDRREDPSSTSGDAHGHTGGDANHHVTSKRKISFAPSMPSITAHEPASEARPAPQPSPKTDRNLEKPADPKPTDYAQKDSGLRFSAPIEETQISGEW
jgi:KaiC/GvpD/RAD55 family RecA-like ATPase